MITVTRARTEGMSPMKVRIEFTLGIDIRAWAAEYGTGTTASVVRADVHTYIRNLVAEALDGLGHLDD